ncbi:MAG TPA: hypothetical protein VIA81_07020 [Acidimicrobiia bacterium]
MTPPDPGSILAIWAAGLAAAVALVTWWRVARAGFGRLGAAIVAILAVLAALAGGGLPAWLAAGLAALFGVISQPVWRTVLATGAAIGLIWAGSDPFGWMVALGGALALGSISGEMLLGHWYLVDPKLPRWPLRRLAILGTLGIAAEAVLTGLGARPDTLIAPLIVVGLAALTAVLMIAVWFALKGRSYAGVMAATGLSYLATLTAVGAVVLGRGNLL